MKIKLNDTVRIILGRDKGKEGKVQRLYTKSNKVLIENLNMFKKHVKKSEQAPQGGLVELSRPLEASNVMIVCPKCNKPVRTGYRFEDSKKVRFCKKCDKAI